MRGVHWLRSLLMLVWGGGLHTAVSACASCTSASSCGIRRCNRAQCGGHLRWNHDHNAAINIRQNLLHFWSMAPGTCASLPTLLQEKPWPPTLPAKPKEAASAHEDTIPPTVCRVGTQQASLLCSGSWQHLADLSERDALNLLRRNRQYVSYCRWEPVRRKKNYYSTLVIRIPCNVARQ
jgi:hypothetical protein